MPLKRILQGEAEAALRELQIACLDEGPQHPSSWRNASDGEWKLIVELNRPDRLYHLTSDPWETRNVAEDHPEVTERLKAELHGYL